MYSMSFNLLTNMNQLDLNPIELNTVAVQSAQSANIQPTNGYNREDIAQETLLKILKSSVRPRTVTYVRSVTQSVAADLAIKYSERTQDPSSASLESYGYSDLMETEEALEELLGALDTDQRAVLAACYLSKYPSGIPRSTEARLKQRIKREVEEYLCQTRDH